MRRRIDERAANAERDQMLDSAREYFLRNPGGGGRAYRALVYGDALPVALEHIHVDVRTPLYTASKLCARAFDKLVEYVRAECGDRNFRAEIAAYRIDQAFFVYKLYHNVDPLQ